MIVRTYESATYYLAVNEQWFIKIYKPKTCNPFTDVVMPKLRLSFKTRSYHANKEIRSP